MNVRMGLIRKRANWTDEDFRSYWLNQHGPLAAGARGLRSYWQNVVIDRSQRGIDFMRGPWDFDGFSQLWFDDERRPNQPFGDGELETRLIADEKYFLDDLHIITARQHEVIATPQSVRSQLLKRISTLCRKTDVTEDDFRLQWKVHADFVRQMPGIKGYRQNVVVQRELVKGRLCSYEQLPIDGIVELWFEDPATLEAAFASPPGQKTMAHAKTFLSEITAFLVQERRVNIKRTANRD